MLADLIEELHAVLVTCAMTEEATCTTIITQEGFTHLADLGVLETDTDVTDMAKRMAMRTQAEGRVLLGTIIIKQLQMLVWWIRDQQKRGLALDAANFDAEAMNQMSEMKTF
jgi:hypothetical protein